MNDDKIPANFYSGAKATINDVFTIVNQLSLQLNRRMDELYQMVKDTNDGFMTMEKGRLTRAESDIIEMKSILKQLRASQQADDRRWEKVFDNVLRIVTGLALLYIAAKLGLHGGAGL